jgi:hypothetical protein
VIDQVYLDEVLYIPDILYFRVLGYKVYIFIKKKQQVKSNKITSRIEINILVGYKNHNIWRIYLPGYYETKVVCLFHVKFDEGGIVIKLFPVGSKIPETRNKGETV